ncbi:type VI secretion protein IcmF/TssM N-terminal domain-containing protein [Tundrisphaera sp. TA3]|uniref:type VI secretion protein IcmF/TssM N-terminal domain-containing protein n=1 Tax=Tundrisphaera sp. TA3 TaxID=3435775 RepID=UPI003EC120CE
MGLFRKIGKGILGLFGLLLPAVSGVRALGHPGPGLRRVLRVVLVALILVGLWAINERLDLERVLRAPVPVLRKVWLPTIFLLLYLMAWMGWWLWKLLTSERESSEFPDIDAAWDEALRALDQASIDLTATPLFLIFGRPAGTPEALFHATQIPFEVGFAPRRADAPLHLSANRDAIFVSCEGASLLARQAELFNRADADRAAPAAPPEIAPAPSLAPASPFDPFDLGPILGAVAPAPMVAAPAVVAPAPDPGPEPRRVVLLKDPGEIALISDRLRHLCRLIARDRRPYCPVNGMLFLIPALAMEDDASADQAGSVCRRDLDIARETLQTQCPTFALVCDLESAPGFREFAGQFPDAHRQRFLGQHFPLLPAIDPADVPRMIRDGVLWIGAALLPTLVYRLWRVESSASGDDPGAAVRDNIRLYHLLLWWRARESRLARLLVRAFVLEANAPRLLGGCYLAGTGLDAERDQSFVAGVFRRLVENQNAVSWTREALASEADDRRWTTIGLAGIVGFVAALIALGTWYWPR